MVLERIEKISRNVKRCDKHAILEAHLLENIGAHLNTDKPANTLGLPLAPEEKSIVRSFFLLTDKPTIFAANVKESDLATPDANPYVTKVRDYARTHHHCDTVGLCVPLERALADLAPAEAPD